MLQSSPPAGDEPDHAERDNALRLGSEEAGVRHRSNIGMRSLTCEITYQFVQKKKPSVGETLGSWLTAEG